MMDSKEEKVTKKPDTGSGPCEGCSKKDICDEATRNDHGHDGYSPGGVDRYGTVRGGIR
jgi:hypothetical protein